MCEPLNLCKKKPVAIVAPSSVVDEASQESDGSEEKESVKAEDCAKPEQNYNSVYNMIRSLANCEQSFLTAMYMGGLVHSNLLASRSVPFLPPNPWARPPPAHKELSISVPRLEIRFPHTGLNIPTLKTSPHPSLTPDKPDKWYLSQPMFKIIIISNVSIYVPLIYNIISNQFTYQCFHTFLSVFYSLLGEGSSRILHTI